MPHPTARTNARATGAHAAGRRAGARGRADPLDAYRRKRDFSRTAEPSGEGGDATAASGDRFVIHKHAASRLHFDLRLEHDGVLLSWAVPKGPSLEPGEKRLAVQVEDHPLDYGDFEGVIPEEEYGGGTVMLWDEGRWRPFDAEGEPGEAKFDFVLEGRRLRGAWTLVPMAGRAGEDGRNWLLIKKHDDDARAAARTAAAAPGDDDASVATGRTMRQIAADRDRAWTRDEGDATPRPPDPKEVPGGRKGSLPTAPKAQLATLASEAPGGDDWIHEIKFDGYRILARWDGSRVTLFSRNGKDWTERFPEIAAALDRLPAAAALLDGEVVALRPDGASSFRDLQAALSEGRTERLVYQVFDLLHLDGRDLTRAGQEDRKRVLHGLAAAAGATGGGTVRYTDHLDGNGPAFLEKACGLGLEGIIAKRRDAPYRAGRTKAWLKAKCTRHQELLIAGFTDPGGSRTGFGALLLGGRDGEGRLVYAGKVGTGFDDATLSRLHARLKGDEMDASPFDPPPKGLRGVHWVRPVHVAEVEFTEWTDDGMLRHPAFRGLREDKDPDEIRLPPLAERDARPATSRAAAAASASGDRAAAGSGGSGGGRGRRPRKGEAEVAGVRLSSPDKVLYPEQGVTKLELARFYEDVADWILPHVRERPLSLVRCPQGHEGTCFFQKHPGESLGKDMARVEIEEKDGPEDYLYVRELPDLITLVQAGVLELHVWGSRVEDVERPDLIVFDLDPGPGVAWDEMLRVARELRDRLDGLGLASLPRTTGGKGLHVVTPLRPHADWDGVKAFAKGVAEAAAADDRERITTNMSKAKRRGKIFLDYLRNGRGATAICSYSTRARTGAPVAVPVRWDELNPALRGDRYDVANLRRRLSALRGDPWADIDDLRRPLTDDLMDAVGIRR